jgi:Zn-dependent peptidase ImmA (M78 family)/DNA-binding XRE family transcriptional regulator
MAALGERLKQARWRRGYSQQTVADRAGVTKQAISKYERGEDTPGSGVLLRLSDALDASPEYFFRTRTVRVEPPVYRRKHPLGRTEEKAIQAEVQDWLERYLEVEDLAGSAPPEASALSRLKSRQIADLNDVEDAAEELRADWQLGLDAIENLTDVLEDKGALVHAIEAPDAFDALTFLVDGRPAIIVNKNQPGDRMRFSIAHELAHNVLEIAPGMDDEKAANRFAAAFLVPRETARAALGPGRRCLDLVELSFLKERYGLSVQGWIHRAEDLGILSRGAAARQFQQLVQAGLRDSEIGPPRSPEQPRRMERLVRRALAEQWISRSRAAELLGMALAEFHAGERARADLGSLALCG